MNYVPQTDNRCHAGPAALKTTYYTYNSYDTTCVNWRSRGVRVTLSHWNVLIFMYCTDPLRFSSCYLIRLHRGLTEVTEQQQKITADSSWIPILTSMQRTRLGFALSNGVLETAPCSTQYYWRGDAVVNIKCESKLNVQTATVIVTWRRSYDKCQNEVLPYCGYYKLCFWNVTRTVANILITLRPCINLANEPLGTMKY